MASDSIGFGIGLQAQAKDYAGIVSQNLAKGTPSERAEAAARSKNEEKFNKIITDKDFIQQAGNFHKLYKGQATKEITGFLNRAIELKKQNPNDYLPSVVEDFQKTQLKLGDLKSNSIKVMQYEKDAANPKLNKHTWFDPDFLQSVNSGTFSSSSDWANVKTRAGLGILFNPDTGDFSASPSPRIGDEDIVKRFTDKANLQDVSTSAAPVPGAGGKQQAITIESEVRPDVVESTVQEATNNPLYLKSKAIEWGVDMSDPNWEQTIKPKVEEYVKGLIPKGTKKVEIKSVSSGGNTYVINKPPSATEYEGGVSAPEKHIIPSKFLIGKGVDGEKTWDEYNQAIADAKKAGLTDETTRLLDKRSEDLRARAKILYAAVGVKDTAIEAILNKPKGALMFDDKEKLNTFFSNKYIKTEDAFNAAPSVLGAFTDVDRATAKNWLATYSATDPSKTKKIVKTWNVEDKSRLKNSPQNFSVVDNGAMVDITNAELLGIDKMEDGSMEVRFKVNGVVKKYPYSSQIGTQIKDKLGVDVASEIEKTK